MRWWAPLGIGVCLSVTYAAFDWIMSLNPHWFSTMFGVIIFAGCMVSGFASLILLGNWLQKNGALTTTLTTGNYHDLGKLMWGFIIFWTYTSFSQYFLIWYGNIPEETEWFLIRMNNGWENVGVLVIFGHFIVPFWVLLSRHVKRNRKALVAAAAWMLFIHYVDIYYMAMPNMPDSHGFHPTLLDLTTILGVGGLYLAAVASRFSTDCSSRSQRPSVVGVYELRQFLSRSFIGSFLRFHPFVRYPSGSLVAGPRLAFSKSEVVEHLGTTLDGDLEFIDHDGVPG